MAICSFEESLLWLWRMFVWNEFSETFLAVEFTLWTSQPVELSSASLAKFAKKSLILTSKF